MLFEHCFGSIVARSSSTGEAMEHTELSTERLRDVFTAVQLLMYAYYDTTRPEKEASKVEKITKGILTATRGPNCPPFDPREPYRAEFTELIRELQGCTADMLNDVMEDSMENEPEALNEVGEIPKDELHGVDTSGHDVRQAKGRLRMDSPIMTEDQLAAMPLQTPDWVLGQYLNSDAWKGLTRSGVIEMPSDILKVSRQGGTVDVEGMTDDRVRFCRLHAAWIRGYCNDRQASMAQKLRDALELEGDTKDGPCPAIGGAQVSVFRCRAEAKGVDRILEKMTEAMEEELQSDRSRSLLEAENPDQEELKLALRELLTPACYVCDINGAEVVVDSFADLATLYKNLKSRTLLNDGHQIVRTKNGFSNKIPQAVVNAKGGYRDLKLWIKVKIDDTPLAAELQLHIRGFYDLKRIMHLPYECSRGSFDHPHLSSLWQAPPAPPAAPPAALPAAAEPAYRDYSTCSYALRPSVGTWLSSAPFMIEELDELEEPVEEPVYKDYSNCGHALMPSVGTWLTLGPVAPFTDEELAAFAEQELGASAEPEPKDPWFTQPSVASWLQRVPPEIERPWFFIDPATFGENAEYVAKLQALLAEKDKELESMKKRVEEAEATL